MCYEKEGRNVDGERKCGIITGREIREGKKLKQSAAGIMWNKGGM